VGPRGSPTPLLAGGCAIEKRLVMEDLVDHREGCTGLVNEDAAVRAEREPNVGLRRLPESVLPQSRPNVPSGPIDHDDVLNDVPAGRQLEAGSDAGCD